MPARAIPQSARRGQIPAAILPAAIWTGLLFGALDSGYGAGLVCLCAAMLLGWQLWLHVPAWPFWRAIAPALAAIFAALSWATIASLGIAPEGTALTPDLAWHGLIGATGYTLLLLLACLIGYGRRSIAAPLSWLLTFGAIDIAAGLMLYATRAEPLFDFWDLGRSHRFLGTVDNANVAGCLCGICAILAAARLLAPASSPAASPTAGRWRIAGCAIVLGLAALGLVLTASRSGVVLVCLALLWLVYVGRSAVATPYRRSIRLLIALGAIVAALLATTLPDRLIGRFSALGQGSVGRSEMWTHYGALALKSPWFGYGFGSFPSLNAREPGGIDLASKLWMVNSPHDIGLHLLLTAGLPYLLFLLAAAVMIGRHIVRARAKRGDRFDRAAALLAAGILFGSSLVDLALEMPAVAALFVTLVGLVWGACLRTAQRG